MINQNKASPDIILVGCVKKKLGSDRAIPAKDLYISRLYEVAVLMRSGTAVLGTYSAPSTDCWIRIQKLSGMIWQWRTCLRKSGRDGHGVFQDSCRIFCFIRPNDYLPIVSMSNCFQS